MNVSIKQINRFFLLVTAPFVGLFIYLLFSLGPLHIQVDTAAYVPADTLKPHTDSLLKELDKSLRDGGERHSPNAKSWTDRVKDLFK